MPKIMGGYVQGDSKKGEKQVIVSHVLHTKENEPFLKQNSSLIMGILFPCKTSHNVHS